MKSKQEDNLAVGLEEQIVETAIAEEFEHKLLYTGKMKKLWVSMLIALMTSILSILSTSTLTGNNDSTVFVLFLGVLIIMLSVYKLGLWGVLVAFLSSLLFCLSIKAQIDVMIFNVAANTIQALTMFFMIHKFRTIDFFREQMGKLTSYKLILFLIGIMYTVLSIMEKPYLIYIFSVILLIFNIVASVLEKNSNKILFFLIICLLPSMTGGLISSFRYLFENNIKEFVNQTLIWTLSNTVLFSTYGYFFLSLLTTKQQKQKRQGLDYIKLSTILFYTATVLWNLLFYFMFINDWINVNTISYIFPWCVGNVFFAANLIFTFQDEIVDRENAFSWFESRAVVAENNTQMLIAIITFLLPLSATYLGQISPSISLIFVLDITCAVISIGLIWVPKDQIIFMSLIKHLKTIFHLYTLSLLLLEAIMIINGSIGG